MDKKPYYKLLDIVDQYLYQLDYNNFNPVDPLELIFEGTKFSEVYLDLDDFVTFHTRELNYSAGRSLVDQYEDVDVAQRIKVIEVLFNIVYYSKIEDVLKKKISNYLNRYNVVFSDDNEYKQVVIDGSEKFLEGSFGKVYLIDDKYVKKQLKSEYWDDHDISSRFKNEFEIQKRLYDSNVRVLGAYDYDSLANSFLMERADFDLYDLLDKNKISFEEQIKLTRQVLKTMITAHKMTIIHRDLHPGNIMIKKYEPFISDFGFAKDSNHLRSRLSSVTPKPTHKFVAPEGFRKFTDLDEISDVYSIGKVIDFIFGNGNLGTAHPFKLLVEKATKDIREERFNTVEDLSESFEGIFNNYLKGVDVKRINTLIQKGIYDTSIEHYLLELAEKKKISTQIVANRWLNLAEILLKCDTSNQEKILRAISITFIQATGYNGWKNYDLFATITYTMVIRSEMPIVIKLAYSILEECAKHRFAADRLLLSVPYEKIQPISEE